MNPPLGISNISEWCKKEACWTRICARLGDLKSSLSVGFINDLASTSEVKAEERQSKKVQVEDDKIQAQVFVSRIPTSTWRLVLEEGARRKLLSPKEADCLRLAQQLPSRVPTSRQCLVIIAALDKLKEDGFSPPL
jgi:hypothetical protein